MNHLSLALLDFGRRKHFCQSLFRADQIIVDGDVVLDFEEDDGSGAEERAAQENPVGEELIPEGELVTVEGPYDSAARGLDTLVETDVVGGSAAGVGQSAHEPICVS